MPYITALFAVALTAVVWLQPGAAQAANWFGAQFSANIEMKSLKDASQSSQGTLYAGNQLFRAEGVHKGQTMAIIFDFKSQQAWTLDPAKKEYFKGTSQPPPVAPDEIEMPGPSAQMCRQQGISCKQYGMEMVGNINTQKWFITGSQQGRQMQMTLWIEPNLKVVIHSKQHNGPTMMRTRLGDEQLNGRTVEKWQIVQSFKEETRQSTLWVDRALKLPVRSASKEMVVELTNIRVQPQSSELFQVPPPGYKQVAAPKKQQNQNRGSQQQQNQQSNQGNYY